MLFILGAFLLIPQSLKTIANSPQPRVLSETTNLPQIRDRQTLPAINKPILVKPYQTNTISAKSFLVYDLATKQTLIDQETGAKLPIASLTKLMTALLVYEQSNFSEIVTITPSDHTTVSPVLNLIPGDKIKVEDLFNAMLIGSNNDAAAALSRYVEQTTKTSFIDLMNKKAAELGMTNSHFSNALGFDNDYNFSTAADLKLLIAQSEQYTAFQLNSRKTSYQFTSSEGRHYSTKATNTLLANNSDIYAIKTGFTNEAGGSMITQIGNSGHDFVIIVLGSGNREQDTLKLKQITEASFKWWVSNNTNQQNILLFK